MDHEEVDHEFTNIALGDFSDQVERLIEGVTACDLGLKQGIQADDTVMIDHMMGHLGGLIQGITIGALPTVLARFGHTVNVERATVEHVLACVHALIPEVQAQVKQLADVVDARGFDALARINDAIQAFNEGMDSHGQKGGDDVPAED